MSKSVERLLAFSFGVVFVVVLLVLAIVFSNPTPFQYLVFRIVLALAAGGVASMIPGFLSAHVGTWLRAGGALAVFVIVYFYSPARLVTYSEQEEIDKPIVSWLPNSTSAGFISVAQAAGKSPDLMVTRDDDLARPGALALRYGTVTIDRVRATVPAGSTLVANDVYGINGGTIVGSDFSIVARKVANLTVDTSGSLETGAKAGAIRLYVKIVQNGKLIARGVAGSPGKDGAPGTPGANGRDGRNGDCGGFGAYRGADGGGDAGNGGNGEDGGPGGDGSPGGFIALTTIGVPVDTVVDVSGGAGGSGGLGGAGGPAGHPGKGGLGCTGLGGSQPNQNGGRDGSAGLAGHNSKPGAQGAKGEYQLVMLRSFDPIVAKLQALPNDKLNNALQLP